MSKKSHKNPYRKGGKYHELFAYWMKKQYVTRSELTAQAEKIGATTAAVGVILSPTASSERGDCRGNMSAKGEVYYGERLKGKVANGDRKETKYRLRWRSEALDPHRRATVKVKSQKVRAKSKAKQTQATAETVDA